MKDELTNGQDGTDSAGVVPTEGRMDSSETEEARVLDPEEYTQKRRIKDILDARRMVNEARTEMQLRAGRDISRKQALQTYRTVLENYLSELRPLLTETYPEQGERYWNDRELGEQTIMPPDRFHGTVKENVREDIYGLKEPAEPVTKRFVGLRDFVEAPRTLSVTFEARLNRRRHDPEMTETRKVPIEWHILDAAYNAANEFVAQIGMDIDPEAERPHGKT